MESSIRAQFLPPNLALTAAVMNDEVVSRVQVRAFRVRIQGHPGPPVIVPFTFVS